MLIGKEIRLLANSKRSCTSALSGFCVQIVMNRENMLTQNTFSQPCTEKTTLLCIEQTGRRAKH